MGTLQWAGEQASSWHESEWQQDQSLAACMQHAPCTLSTAALCLLPHLGAPVAAQCQCCHCVPVRLERSIAHLQQPAGWVEKGR